MYQPPPGRPISSPPANGSEWHAIKVVQPSPYRRVSDEEKASILADHAAGMNWQDMSHKYRRSSSVIGAIVARAKKGDSTARPVRITGESKQKYGARVMAWMWKHDEEFRANQLRKRKLVARRRRAAKEREAAETVAAVSPAPAADIPPAIVAAPPPTLWQRIVGWFR